MKLLSKISIYYFIVSVVVFVICGTIFYFVFTAGMNNDVDETLLNQKQKIIAHIKKNNTVPNFELIYDVQIKIDSLLQFNKNEIIKDTVIYSDIENENVPYRTLIFTENVNQKPYRFSLFKSLLEAEDLVQSIFVLIVLLLLFTLSALLIMNIFISKRILTPFYIILQKLNLFDITSNKTLELEHYSIKEFENLRVDLLAMTEKARIDYLNQKEFIENASHEIQTPLAIIKMKCEVLLQAENRPESEVNAIMSINETANRLSKLNQALLLLTKIDNLQFNINEKINFQTKIEKHIEIFEDLILFKEIRLTKDFQYPTELEINAILADILISNLLNNAIKHNVPGGEIFIKLTRQELIIRNTGVPLTVEPEKLFKRFFKDKIKQDSLGLGLTIVKKITDLYNMDIQYIHENKNHLIKIIFQY